MGRQAQIFYEAVGLNYWVWLTISICCTNNGCSCCPMLFAVCCTNVKENLGGASNMVWDEVLYMICCTSCTVIQWGRALEAPGGSADEPLLNAAREGSADEHPPPVQQAMNENHPDQGTVGVYPIL